jgi:hypothetical protein
MQQPERRYSGDEMVRRANEIYARLKPQVEEGNIGKFILIDVETGEYEIDRDDIVAGDRLYARLPDPQLFCMRIGYRAAHSFGGSLERTAE